MSVVGLQTALDVNRHNMRENKERYRVYNNTIKCMQRIYQNGVQQTMY